MAKTMPKQKNKECLVDGIKLVHPIHTLDHMELFPTGSILSFEAIKSVILSNQKNNYAMCPFLHHNTVEKDMQRILATHPYSIIFNPDEINHLFMVMEKVLLSTPVLDILEFFKENDFYTYRHFLIVFGLTTLLIDDLIADISKRNQVYSSSPSHDFGKICVPLSILKKVDPLTQSEREIIHQHTVAGYILISYYQHDLDNFNARVALDHHERKDGTGYPRGIHTLDYMTEIVAVCDIYDALISQRPYRPVSYENRTALEEITTMAREGKIGWNVVRALIARNRKGKPHYSTIEISAEQRGQPPANNAYGLTSDD